MKANYSYLCHRLIHITQSSVLAHHIHKENRRMVKTSISAIVASTGDQSLSEMEGPVLVGFLEGPGRHISSPSEHSHVLPRSPLTSAPFFLQPQWQRQRSGSDCFKPLDNYYDTFAQAPFN